MSPEKSVFVDDAEERGSSSVGALNSLWQKLSSKNIAAKIPLEVSRNQWLWTGLFFFCAILTGLKFPLGILFLLMLWFNRWKHNRYDLVIQLMIVFGGLGLTYDGCLPVDLSSVAFVLSIGLVIIFRRPPIVVRTLLIIIAYFVFLLWIASKSDESFRVQIPLMRFYIYFIVFIFPLVIFHNRPFNMLVFMQRLIPYMLLMSICYIFDGFVFSSQVLVPGSYNWSGVHATFATLHPFGPWGSYRVMPIGMILMYITIYPISRYFKLKTWMWLVIFGGLLASRTFTNIAILVVFYAIFSGKTKTLLKYSLFSVLGFVAIYALDRAVTPPLKYRTDESTLRVYSSIRQFQDLYENIEDEELVADFASGRMAQFLPKLDLVKRLHLESVGLGFLHPEKTKNPKYFIHNDLYTDVTKADELAVGVEIGQAQIFLNTGWLGLIANALYWFLLWFNIRKLPGSGFFLGTFLVDYVGSLNGNATIISVPGNLMIAVAYAAVLLANRPYLKGFRKLTQQEIAEGAEMDGQSEIPMPVQSHA